MLVTKPAVITEEWEKLQILNMTGEQIEFTKLEVGSGLYSDEEATKEALSQRTSLKDRKQLFGISSMDVSDDGKTLIFSSMITNVDLDEEYTIRELGLYARIKDQPETECMVSISLAEIEDVFPSYDGTHESRILMKYQFTVSNSDTVYLSYEHDPVALVAYVDAKDKVLDEKIQNLQKLFPGLSAPTEADIGKSVNINSSGQAEWGSRYIVFPEFTIDFSTGHLSATGGSGVNFSINVAGHLESEVL
ncbi:MAG: hypothetical protein J6C00_13055 [Eubacterium sp.]|nr:hypothetical protein [Eubacterium sp.]